MRSVSTSNSGEPNDRTPREVGLGTTRVDELIRTALRELAPTLTWGDRVRVERLTRQWTQRQLAQHAGISQQQVVGLERGTRTPTRTTLTAIARALQVPAADLFPYDDAADYPADADALVAAG